MSDYTDKLERLELYFSYTVKELKLRNYNESILERWEREFDETLRQLLRDSKE